MVGFRDRIPNEAFNDRIPELEVFRDKIRGREAAYRDRTPGATG